MFGYKSNCGSNLNCQYWVDSFVINCIVPIKIAFALKNSIKEHGKYIVISSRRGSNKINIEDNYCGRYSYRSSKAAVNSALIALTEDFRKSNIYVLMLHPGRVKTEMTKFTGIETDLSAKLIKNTIDSRSMKDSGAFIDVQNNKILPW